MTDQTFTFSFDAPPAVVYRAMLNEAWLPQWRVPDNMMMTVHRFEPVEGGRFRVSLSYRDNNVAGKSGGHVDTYRGYLRTLVPNEKIVEAIEFETDDKAMAGVMVITTELQPVYGGTLLTATHENLPAGVSPEQNEAGWIMSLHKLARLLETR